MNGVKMSQVASVYDPAIFDVGSIEEAVNIILTEDSGVSSHDRWEKETPYLVQLMRGLNITEKSVVLDYGCGIGRLSRALIEAYGCTVVGVDISANMRAFASHYVGNHHFMACHPSSLDKFGIKFDAALAVWVLQHSARPESDVERIAGALKPDARFFVLNEERRFVPTKEVTWVDDGVSVRDVINGHFKEIQSGKPDSASVAPGACERAYWGLFSS